MPSAVELAEQALLQTASIPIEIATETVTETVREVREEQTAFNWHAEPTAPTPVTVLLADIQGKPVSEVLTSLTEKGLVAEAIPGNKVELDDPKAMTVYDATPLGNMPEGSSIQVYYYVVDMDAPTPSPEVTP